MSKLEELKAVLDDEGLTQQRSNLEIRYRAAIRNSKVRELLDLETPKITDLTEVFKIENNGKLHAVRMDLNQGVDNHKKPVVAGLILRNVLQGRIPKKGIDTLIDGGNYNSAKAVKYYSEKFGMQGMYIMSRLFLQKPKILDELRSVDFEIEIAPDNPNKGLEREFYDYLFQRMRDNNFRRNKVCLWHAKYGGRAMYPFGREIAEQLTEGPDYIVSCLGAGSTLEGLQIAVQDHYIERGSSKNCKIIIGEHELSPLFAKFLPTKPSPNSPKYIKEIRDSIREDYYGKVNGLSHVVIGPHYDELNPLLPQEAIGRIDGIIQYSSKDCAALQEYLFNREISVGNSSAANLNVAAHLANQGHTVLTVVFEPFRRFYKEN